MSTTVALRKALEAAGIEFIDENGGGPGCGYESGTRRRARQYRGDYYSSLGLSLWLDRRRKEN
jgi:hypothetical protein